MRENTSDRKPMLFIIIHYLISINIKFQMYKKSDCWITNSKIKMNILEFIQTRNE